MIGCTAGNALEVKGTLDYLSITNKELILHELVATICIEMLVQGKLANKHKQGLKMVNEVLTSGKAAEIFARMVSALGGLNDLLLQHAS